MLFRKLSEEIYQVPLIPAQRDASFNVATLGGFALAKRPKRTGRNPSTGERARPSGTPTMYETGIPTMSRSIDDTRLV